LGRDDVGIDGRRPCASRAIHRRTLAPNGIISNRLLSRREFHHD
jgi:hypothetical protein